MECRKKVHAATRIEQLVEKAIFFKVTCSMKEKLDHDKGSSIAWEADLKDTSRVDEAYEKRPIVEGCGFNCWRECEKRG